MGHKLKHTYITLSTVAVVFSKEARVTLLLSVHNLNNSTNLEPEFTNKAHIPDEEIFACATGL